MRNEFIMALKGHIVSEETRIKIGEAGKGRTPWNKGISGLFHHSEETKKQISEKMKGRRLSEETKRKISKTHKGKRPYEMTEEIRKKISRANKGRIPWCKGKHLSEETRRKISEAQRKEKHWNWKGGIATYGRKLFLNARRRARKRNAEGSHTYGEWERLKAQYNWTCPACGRSEPEIKLTEDHIVPLSRGGSDNIENIQPLCRSCNSKKHTKVIKYR